MKMATNNPKYIIVHCSASDDTPADNWQALRHYHRSKGWVDIGYHYGVELVGDNYEIRKGRPEEMNGAHCVEDGMNTKSLGVCMVGGDPGDGFGSKYPLPEEQYNVTVGLIANLCLRWNIPTENVRGHREYARKTCPGVGVDLDKLRADVAAARKPETIHITDPPKPAWPEHFDILSCVADDLEKTAKKIRALLT
jgi:hypothetical protein